MHRIGLIFSFLIPFALLAQVSTAPAFPLQTDDVTVYYDATAGNAALEGYTGDIYAHTGIITELSNSPTDWRYVKFDWGENNDEAKLTPLGNDQYQLEFNIQDYYNPGSETVEELAFVFRNEDGSIVGRSADGSDIYTSVFNPNAGLQVNFTSPTNSNIVVTMGQQIQVNGMSSESATLTLYDNGSQISTATGTELNYLITANNDGAHLIELVADDGMGNTASVSFSYAVPGTPLAENFPPGTKLGINYLGVTGFRLRLHAPNKQHVYVLGDFNNWTLDNDYFMKRTTNGDDYWLDITGLEPFEDFSFQYLVDGEILIADPHSELILDPSNDQWVTEEVYPNLPAYPAGKTNGIVTSARSGGISFNWQVDNFVKPAKKDLVIYELLMRDFLEDHSYTSLKDTLDYLERLGVNAIELMPVNEFEGNDSWGYNPSFHMALDKYYGDKNSFKAFIDEAHSRGIAVILDVVYNHAFSQSPLCQLYWDDEAFKPTADNPWLNPDARHPFNVGYDFNHESQSTQNWMDRVVEYWLEEYRIDGFRFDLSKGFTQTNNPTNVGAWSNFDQSRIDILKRLADVVWAASPDAYVILEHLAVNSEETVLSDYGMMLWGNMNYNYNEATMGYTSNDLYGASNLSRGWSEPHLVSYMESHDEERLMNKNYQFGNSSGDYDVKNFVTGLNRNELGSAFYYTIPGPKMLWQFGELGYDYSINHCEDGSVSEDCRLSPKPIRWDYYNNFFRKRLFNVTAALIHLKKDYPVFSTTDYNLNIGSGYLKSIQLNHTDMNVNVIGNFDVVENNIDPNFQNTGTWYNYFTGEILEVNDVNENILLEPGEYQLYTSVQLPAPPGGFVPFPTSNKNVNGESIAMQVYPNPNNGIFLLEYQLEGQAALAFELYDVAGKLVWQEQVDAQASGLYSKLFNMDLENGIYTLKMKVDDKVGVRKISVLR